MSRYVFGRFCIDCDRRTFSANGTAVQISSRAFDILQMLLRNRDRVVTKEEIFEQVWGKVIVEENNLAVQISALRKALKDAGEAQWIVTVQGRGYRFVGQVTEVDGAPPEGDAPPSRPPDAIAASPVADPLPRRTAVLWLSVGALMVAALAAGLALWSGLARRPAGPDNPQAAHPGDPPRLSIVVLPFRNLGGDPQDDYLADAVGDDLTTDLSHLPGSFVIARQSAELYKGRSAPADQVGRELGVRYLLEGSVRRVDDKILINAQLIDSQSGSHLWADRFDTSQQKLSEAQAEIVGRIGSALNFQLVQIEGQRSARERPDNPDALDLFLRGRSILDRDNTLAGLERAQNLFEQAIARQPDFGEAMSDLAWLLLTKARDYDDPAVAQDTEEARRLLSQALALSPDNARALAARGFLLMVDEQYEEASASYRLALSYDPNSVPARLGLARCASALGHPDETVRLIGDALKIDPLNPQDRARFYQLGMALMMLGRSAEALPWLQKASAGNANPPEYNEMALIAAYWMNGRPDDARAKYAEYVNRWPHRSAWRQACYATKAESELPGFKQMFAALQEVGMPGFADEAADDGVAPPPEPRQGGDFEATPLTAPGMRTIATAELAQLTQRRPPPVLVDVGCGGAVAPGALWLRWVEEDSLMSPEGMAKLKTELAPRAPLEKQPELVVMGSGPYGWNSYNAALALRRLGYRNIAWYRGGEEAWAAAGQPAEDHRVP